MPTRFELTTRQVSAGRLLLYSLVTTFVAEYVIMKTLPMILVEGYGDTYEALADACLLTLVVAPVLWLVGVQPIQRLAGSRMHFLRRALTAQEEERRRITQDLHDGLGQSLTSLMLGLRAMEETTSDARVRAQAQELRSMGVAVHEDLRRIVRGLRPAILDQLGLAPAIERLVDDVREPGVRAVRLEVSGLDDQRLSPELESTAFRIVQEAVSNSVRHSRAGELTVRLTIHRDELELRVADNGTGFDASVILDDRDSDSYGLLGIRERAMISGGRAEILTSPNAGTEIVVHLPLLNRSHPRA